jgi:DNA-binding Lrp family transcriptional regulator
MTSTVAVDTTIVDELDLGIIHCLQLDARVPFRRVAEVLGVSEQTVARRFRRMREEGLIRVVSIQSPASFGQTSWMVRIRARPDSARALASALADRDDVAWVTIASGGTDISAALHSRSAADRDELLLERLPRAAQVLGFTVHSVIHRFSRPDGVDWTVQSALLTPAAERELTNGRAGPDGSSDARLTADDAALVTALTADGRVTIAELATRTGWSEARAARRMNALIRSGALYLDVDVALEVLGFSSSVDIWLTVEPAHLDAVGRALAELPEIAFCAAITGAVNLIAVAIFHSSSELYGFLTDRIGPLPGIREAEVSPVLRQVKQAASFVEGERLTSRPIRR